MEVRTISSFIISGLTGLIIGYFVGREHLKYEMHSAFQSTAEKLKQNFFPSSSKPNFIATSNSVEPPVATNEPILISVRLLKKGFHAANPSVSDYQDAITFSVLFSNLTDKNIRAFDGVLEFTDLLDNKIIGAKVAINESVVANSPFNWEGQLDYNQFMPTHRRLRDEEQPNLKVSFSVRKILFSDGTMKKLGN